MSNLSTTGSGEAATTQETGAGRELQVRPGNAYRPATGAEGVVGSELSDALEAVYEGGSYVFRIVAGKPVAQVTITLETRHLAERERVRRVNREIRRALQR